MLPPDVCSQGPVWCQWVRAHTQEYYETMQQSLRCGSSDCRAHYIVCSHGPGQCQSVHAHINDQTMQQLLSCSTFSCCAHNILCSHGPGQCQSVHAHIGASSALWQVLGIVNIVASSWHRQHCGKFFASSTLWQVLNCDN